VLWLEHDLYDQAALVRVLASFALRKTLPRIELICIDRFRGIKRFTGLGQAHAGAARLAVAQAQARRPPAARPWRACLGCLARHDARPLEALLKSDLRELPFLKGALQRHLQELRGRRTACR